MPRGRKKVTVTEDAPKVRRPRVAKTTKPTDESECIRAKTIVKDTLVPVMSETTIRRETAFDASDLGWTVEAFPKTLKYNGTTYTKDTTYLRPSSKIVAYVDYVKRDRKGDLAEIIPVFNA